MCIRDRYNRLAEFMNQDAESLYVFLNQEGQCGYPREHLKRVWELTLLNQFHDILPGSSIQDVYEDSREQYEEVLELDFDMTSEALMQLSGVNEQAGVLPRKDREFLTVFNTTSFDREDSIESEGHLEAVSYTHLTLPTMAVV